MRQEAKRDASLTRLCSGGGVPFIVWPIRRYRVLFGCASGDVPYPARWRAEREVVPFVYAGAAIVSPAWFVDTPAGAFPLTLLFDRACAEGRLFGLRLEGIWMHVGTPDAVRAAERAFLASVA